MVVAAAAAAAAGGTAAAAQRSRGLVLRLSLSPFSLSLSLSRGLALRLRPLSSPSLQEGLVLSRLGYAHPPTQFPYPPPLSPSLSLLSAARMQATAGRAREQASREGFPGSWAGPAGRGLPAGKRSDCDDRPSESSESPHPDGCSDLVREVRDSDTGPGRGAGSSTRCRRRRALPGRNMPSAGRSCTGLRHRGPFRRLFRRAAAGTGRRNRVRPAEPGAH